MRRSWCTALAAALLAASTASALAANFRGTVEDPTGAPIAGAVVSTGSGRTTTDSRGRFELPSGNGGDLTVAVEKPGFRRADRNFDPESLAHGIRIVLEPAPVTEEVVVTARRAPARLGDTAASVRVVSAEDLETAASPTLDDALRQVPGFVLFRRSGSRTANPTSQGVSLRGTGASGASRAVVLADGVPLNDPFGGWVYWGRVPRASLERVEVLRGGVSDVWGSGALSGAIQLVRRESDFPAALALEASRGSQETGEGSLFSAVRLPGGFVLSASAEALSTRGYVIVAPDERGPIEAAAGSRRAAADVAAQRRDGAGRVFVRASWFDEERENGTPLQENDTRITHVSAGGERRVAGGAISLRAWGTDQEYHQSFSVISADRRTERPSRLQEVPSDALGASVQWTANLGAHVLSAGFEGRRVRGESREEIFGGAAPTFVTAGGEELAGALFVEDTLAVGPRVSVTGALRFDSWENRDAQRSNRAEADEDAVSARLADRSESAWSPRLALLYRASSALALSASAYRAFRAPTLNELYRSFRVGNVETLANERLDAERLRGGELGTMLSRGPLFARAVAFWTEITEAIGNVTLESSPALVTRQRRNLGRIRSRGVELDLETRVARDWKVSTGYLFADSSVVSAREAPELVGRRTPQVARHQASVVLKYDHPRVIRAVLQARWVSRQFEDDQNRLSLRASFTADAFLSRALVAGLEAFVAVENVFDERAEVGRTPVRTIGPPRTFRGGLRLRLPKESS